MAKVKMSAEMRAILERVLSQELANQYVWSKQDVETFGEHMNRNNIIKEIDKFMADNEIPVNNEWYMKAFFEAERT